MEKKKSIPEQRAGQILDVLESGKWLSKAEIRDTIQKRLEKKNGGPLDKEVTLSQVQAGAKVLRRACADLEYNMNLVVKWQSEGPPLWGLTEVVNDIDEYVSVRVKTIAGHQKDIVNELRTAVLLSTNSAERHAAEQALFSATRVTEDLNRWKTLATLAA